MKTVEIEWSHSKRGTALLEVPAEATDDEIMDVFWDLQFDNEPDRSDFEYEITEVRE